MPRWNSISLLKKNCKDNFAKKFWINVFWFIVYVKNIHSLCATGFVKRNWKNVFFQSMTKKTCFFNSFSQILSRIRIHCHKWILHHLHAVLTEENQNWLYSSFKIPSQKWVKSRIYIDNIRIVILFVKNLWAKKLFWCGWNLILWLMEIRKN